MFRLEVLSYFFVGLLFFSSVYHCTEVAIGQALGGRIYRDTKERTQDPHKDCKYVNTGKYVNAF